jgi:hypothetical protein
MSNRETRQTMQDSARASRVSVAEARDKTTVQGKDPSREYRWVLDEGNRLAIFENAGYRFETDKSNLIVGTNTVSTSKGQGSKITLYCGKDREGNKQYSYLMSIDKEWYDEDQAKKAAEVDSLEEGMQAPEGEYGVEYGSVTIGTTQRDITLKRDPNHR